MESCGVKKWKEEVTVKFEVLSRHLTHGTQPNVEHRQNNKVFDIRLF